MTQVQWITLARIVRPQGRRGEVLAELFTDFPDLYATSHHLVIFGSTAMREPAKVESFWRPAGRNEGRIVLKLAGVNSISEAEKLTGQELQLPGAERIALDGATFYVNDLVGCELCDGDHTLGKVSDLHFPVSASGRRLKDAAALFIVKTNEEQELLVPFANAYVRRIDVETKRIIMDLPAGLLNLNS